MTKTYFTFCYNGVPHGSRNECTEALEKDNDFLSRPHKYAFAVGTNEPDAAFAELAREPLFRRLLGPVLFGWDGGNCLVISSKPNMIQEIASIGPGAALRVKSKDGEIYKFPARELGRQCISTIKFGLNCVGCRHHMPEEPGDCYLRLLLRHVGAMGWSQKRFLPPESTLADTLRPPELDDFLVKAVEADFPLTNGYYYIRPKTACLDADLPRYDKIGYLRFYDTLDITAQTIEANKKRFHERACNAAATRRKQAACRKQCVFAPCDLFSQGGRVSHINICLEDRDVPGPYPQERLAQIYRAWMKTFTRMRTPEEIAFIAFNAGKITRVFGCELTLGGMDKNLELVEFVGYRGKYFRYFSFEDTLEILRTPWRDGGDSYSRVHLRKAPEMPEEQLWTYAEIRQHHYIPSRSYWGGAGVPIAWVKWHNRGFTLASATSWDRRVNDIEDAAVIFGMNNTIRTPAKGSALEEADYLESNPGTQP